jgi:hypothetical protein
MVPIVIICFNNHVYVKNTVRQLGAINPAYIPTIRIMDNCSTRPETIDYLRGCGLEVIWNSGNVCPQVGPHNNTDVYNALPDRFILTDPDLQFNSRLPADFVDVLVQLSKKYGARAVGFALDISDGADMFQDTDYFAGQSITEWESQFWHHRIHDDAFELYHATIDTTFVLLTKNASNPGLHIRVAGDFTARHLPWYPKNDIVDDEERRAMLNYSAKKISTIEKLIERHLSVQNPEAARAIQE